jgi:plasmid stabilization system protein ParE
MGTLKVVFTPVALDDLQAIVEFISEENPESAQRIGDKLVHRALSLGEPHRCQSGARLRNRPEIRKLVEGRYLVMYKVVLEQKTVRILRFWHGAREISFFDLDI